MLTLTNVPLQRSSEDPVDGVSPHQMALRSSTCRCLHCDEVVRVGAVSDVLLIYCQSCFDFLLIKGGEDVTLDVALVYFL